MKDNSLNTSLKASTSLNDVKHYISESLIYIWDVISEYVKPLVNAIAPRSVSVATDILHPIVDENIKDVDLANQGVEAAPSIFSRKVKQDQPKPRFNEKPQRLGTANATVLGASIGCASFVKDAVKTPLEYATSRTIKRGLDKIPVIKTLPEPVKEAITFTGSKLAGNLLDKTTKPMLDKHQEQVRKNMISQDPILEGFNIQVSQVPQDLQKALTPAFKDTAQEFLIDQGGKAIEAIKNGGKKLSPAALAAIKRQAKAIQIENMMN